jgi:hypothetical protein
MKALDSWARQFGYADFDTYISTGGNIADAARDIRLRIRRLEDALTALTEGLTVVTLEPENPTSAGNLDLTTGKLEDEPPDPENAQIQGAEYGEP